MAVNVTNHGQEADLWLNGEVVESELLSMSPIKGQGADTYLKGGEVLVLTM